MILDEVVRLYKNISFDMDGVICEDPQKDISCFENYIDHVKNAKLKFLPPFKIKYIVTGRRNSLRNETEIWLKRNNVKYKTLIMNPLVFDNVYEYKANIYRNLDSDLFIESDAVQAEQIAKLSEKLVYCTENNKMY